MKAEFRKRTAKAKTKIIKPSTLHNPMFDMSPAQQQRVGQMLIGTMIGTLASKLDLIDQLEVFHQLSERVAQKEPGSI